MAVDEAILEGIAQGISPPTLRLYAWDPPCLSLGYAQPAATSTCSACKPTAGTWCVAPPAGGPSCTPTS